MTPPTRSAIADRLDALSVEMANIADAMLHYAERLDWQQHEYPH